MPKDIFEIPIEMDDGIVHHKVFDQMTLPESADPRGAR